MDDQRHVPISAGIFLVIVGLIADSVQFFLTLIAIGFLLSPIVSAFTAMVFGITLAHNGRSMFSGKRSWAGWLALFSEIIPGIDGLLPGWTGYALYLTFSTRITATAEELMQV